MAVSVIIPAHNEQGYIENTLKSVCYNNPSEIIVVCNGCTDNTFDVVMNFKKRNKTKNIRIFDLKKKGVSAARNYGARKAKANKLVFLDADIIMEKEVVTKIDNAPYTIGTCYAKPDINKFVPNMFMSLKNIAHYFGTCTGLIFCTKELFNKVGGFDETLHIGEDGKFLRQAKKIGNYGVVHAYVRNSMRRFEKKGYLYVCWFWVKQFFWSKTQEYETVR